MLIAFVLFIIVALVIGGGAIFSPKTVEGSADKYTGEKKIEDFTSWKLGGKIVATAFILLAGLMVVFSSLHFVPAGRAGLVTQFGAVTGRTIEPGPNFTWPFFESVVLYDTRVQKIEFVDLDSASAELQDVKVTGVLNYRVNPKAVSWLYQNVGSAEILEEKVLIPALSQNLKSILPRYAIVDILPNRAIIAEQLTAAMTTTFLDYRTDDGHPVIFFSAREFEEDDNVVICERSDVVVTEPTEIVDLAEDLAEDSAEDSATPVPSPTVAPVPTPECAEPTTSVFISNVAFTDEFNAAIEEKQTELQKIEKERNILEQVKIKADQEVAKARGEADANELLAASLAVNGNFILQFKAIEALAPNINVLLLDAQNGLIPILGESLLTGSGSGSDTNSTASPQGADK